jgi:hypothetical protein
MAKIISGLEVVTATFSSSITMGASADIVLDASGTNFTTGNATFAENVTITKNLTVNGTTTTVGSANLVVTDNTITINDGEVGAGVTAGSAGLLIDRGSSTNYELIFQESDDTVRIGEVGSTQALSTREDSPTDGAIPIWNDTSKQFDTALGLDAAKTTQLQNISTTTITATQWGYLGATDQALATTDAVQFLNFIADSGNTFVGDTAGDSNTTGTDNTFIGVNAGTANTSGISNIFIGDNAGAANLIGDDNVFLGKSAGAVSVASDNVFIGSSSGVLNTTGASNVFVGVLSGDVNTTGANNTFLGANSGGATTIGGTNTFIGSQTGLLNTTGVGNTFLGYDSGASNTTGTNNVFIGQSARASTATDSNKLQIANGTGKSLIQGEFNNNNVALCRADNAPTYGDTIPGVGVINISDATTDPTGIVTGGGVLYSTSGVLHWLDSAGVDFTVSTENNPFNQNLNITNNVTFADITSTAEILASDGAVGTPSITFTSDPNTGIYNIGADQIGFTTNGTCRLDIGTSAMMSTLQFSNAVGSAGAPAYSFTGDLDSGVYNVGADNIGISTGGSLRFDASTTAVTSTLPVVHPAGTAGAPSATFTGETDSGMYVSGTGRIGISANGSLITDIGATDVKVTASNGELYLQDTQTDATDRDSYFVSVHRTVAEEPVMLVGLEQTATVNKLILGGGATGQTYNSATSIILNVADAGAANDTTPTAILDASSTAVIVGSASISSGSVQFRDGAVGTPAIAFTGDVDSGIYLDSGVGVAVGGANVGSFQVGGLIMGSSTDIVNQLGAAATPSYTFTSDENTGMYSSGADVLDFSAGGANILSVSATAVTVAAGILLTADDGTAAAPSINSNVDADTGLYFEASKLNVTTSGAARMCVTDTVVHVKNEGVALTNTAGSGITNAPAGTQVLFFDSENLNALSSVDSSGELSLISSGSGITILDSTGAPLVTALNSTQKVIRCIGDDTHTLNLPAVAISTGQEYFVILATTVPASDTVTLDGNASETIDISTTVVLDSTDDRIHIVCDGVKWHTF